MQLGKQQSQGWRISRRQIELKKIGLSFKCKSPWIFCWVLYPQNATIICMLSNFPCMDNMHSICTFHWKQHLFWLPSNHTGRSVSVQAQQCYMPWSWMLHLFCTVEDRAASKHFTVLLHLLYLCTCEFDWMYYKLLKYLHVMIFCRLHVYVYFYVNMQLLAYIFRNICYGSEWNL